jgi:hypothetical protein
VRGGPEGQSAFEAEDDVPQFIAEGLLDDARQARVDQVLDHGAQLIGEITPFAVHLDALAAARFLIGSHLVLERTHLVLELTHLVLELSHTPLGKQLGIVELVELDTDAGRKVGKGLLEAIDPFHHRGHTLLVQVSATLATIQ